MKFFKKTMAVIAAAAMAMGALSVASYADDLYKVHVDAPDASVGESVEVKVVIDAGSTGVGGISFMLSYDSEELELVSAKPGEDLNDWITGDVDDEGNNSFNLDTPGKIGFAYVTMGKGFSEKSVDLIIASFKVLKPNAAFTLTNVDVTADDIDGTDITSQGSSEDAVVKCSHKNTDTKTTPATCKDSGKKETVCKDCGTVLEIATIPATGEHDWEEEVTKAASCTEKGSKTLTCKVCGTIKTEEIPALDHDWGSGTVTKEPTCTEKGEKIFTCSRCGETKTEEVPETSHDWDEWTVTKEATEEEEGEETRVCKNCGEKETRPIAKLTVESTTTSYSGGGFYVPETTTTSTTPAESEEVTTAATTTTAPVITQAPETTTTAAVTTTTAAPVENNTTMVNTDGNANSGAPNTENNNVGNIDNENSDSENSHTGVVLAVIPVVAAAAGVIIFKKRK